MKKATLIVEHYTKKPKQINITFNDLLHIQSALKADAKTYREVAMKKESSDIMKTHLKIRNAIKYNL